ncbi:MAG: hypothetical protein FJY85_11725 [Deltaproteobacteria bacterium]|nr:hypothetical protein [Deltaproteobacteria bacterium]
MEAKFEPVAPSQGRAYCDRIFQLSVNVPSWQTDIERYLKGWLEVACFRSDDKDVKDYVRLLRFSVGFNPRRVKRIFNKLVFVARVRPEICADEHQEAEQISRTQKLLFGVGCIESQYPSLYRTLLRMLDDEGGLVRLMNEQLQDREQIGRLDESLSILGNASDKPEAAQRLIGLVDAFLDILFEGDWSKRLDTDKGRELSDLIGLMSTTMGPRPEDLGEAEKRNALTEFVRRVNDRLFRLLGEAAPKGSDTAIRNWPSSRPWFGLWYTDGDARKAWGPGRLYYEMSFDTENQNILTVSLKCNTHRLRELGVMKEQLAQLKHLAALEDKGFRYKDHGTGLVEIVKVLHQCHCDSMRQLKDDEAESAADELRTLVEVTHTLFDIGLPPSSPVIERPAPVSVHAIPCKVCNSNMERMTMKDGSVGYKCNTCKKIYKPKPTSRSDQQS